MKLSKKGYEKLFEFFMSGKYFDATKCDQIEFEPDDFEGGCCQNGNDHINLTVEEAKRLHDCAMWFWCDYEGTQFFTHDDERFLTDMQERIAKAEKSYE